VNTWERELREHIEAQRYAARLGDEIRKGHTMIDDQKIDMVSLHIPRTDWRTLREVLFVRQIEALQGSRHTNREEPENPTLYRIREALRVESATLKRILDDLDSQAI